MPQSVTEFLSNIEALLSYLKYEEKSQLYLRKGIRKYSGKTPFEVEFRTFVNETAEHSFIRSKVFSYQNAIISLYGYFERFIEDIVVEYLKSISNICPEYKELPSSIRKNHLALSLDLINKIQKTKGRTVEERKISLNNAVFYMNVCLQEKSNFIINFDAFVNHSSNFRYDSIHEVFSRIGIEGISRKCLKNIDFIDVLSQKYNLEGSTNHKILISLLMSELDDLAQRRNEIAHGVRVDDIESIDMTISRINLIKAYGQAIDWVVMNSLEQYTFTVSPKIALGKADKIFPNLNVIGFSQSNHSKDSDVDPKFSEGDLLFAVNEHSTEKIVSGIIVSLRRDGISEKTIELPCDKPFSIGVDFDISTNFEKRLIYVVSLV